MTAAELRRRRATAQLLGGARAADPAAAVAHLLAVQAQDLRAARLALRARRAATRAAAVDAVLSNDRTLVVTWLMRGTLHLVAREDLGWLHALTAPLAAATSTRRLAQLGGDLERARPVVLGALADDGPLARPQLAERVAAAGLPAQGQVVPHVLSLIAAAGEIVLGPVHDGVQRFALTHDWLGPPGRSPARDSALAELARRYLRAHGPAAAADLASWAGLPLRDARAGLTAIARELRQDGELVDLRARGTPRRPAPVLLPAFDPYLLGWRDRGFAVAPEHARTVHPGGGIVRATALANGRAVAVWRFPRGRVALEPFAPPAAALATALAREAAAVERFEHD
jgi:hypothetical protein